MAKKNVRNYGRKALSLLLTLVMLVSTMQLTAFAAPRDDDNWWNNNQNQQSQQTEKADWSYAYYLGQEYFGAKLNDGTYYDPVEYGMQGKITSLTFEDDNGREWTFEWCDAHNGEWRITNGSFSDPYDKGVTKTEASDWPVITPETKIYTGYCGDDEYRFTLGTEGKADGWTYVDENAKHANWFYYIRFIREYTVYVYYQNDTGEVLHQGVYYAVEDPITNDFKFYYPNGNILGNSEYEDAEYTKPVTLMPADYLPQSMIDQGYEISHAEDADGNDVTESGVTISLFGDNELHVYCSLVAPETVDYTVVHEYYTNEEYDGEADGGTLSIPEGTTIDGTFINENIQKVPVYEDNEYTYTSYDVDPDNKVITLTYEREVIIYHDLVVNYITDDGTPLMDPIRETKEEGTAYTTEEKSFDGYAFVETTGDEPEGTMDSDKEVTYVYRQLASYTLIVNYVDESGDALTASIQESKDEGEEYTTEEKSFDGYTFVETTGDATEGTMDSDKEVTYVYSKDPVYYTLTVNYLDTQGNVVAAQVYESDKLEGTAYITTLKTVDGYTFKEITGDAASGTMDSDKVVNYIYEKNPVYYSLTVNYLDTEGNVIAAQVVESGKLEGTAYTTEQKDVTGYTFKETTGHATSGTMDGNKVVNYIYEKNPNYYTLTVNYLDVQGNVVAAQVVESGKLEGAAYTTEQKDVTGYTFKETTGDATEGTMDGDKTVNYIYERIPNYYTLTVNYLDTEGNVVAQQVIETGKLENSAYTTTQKDVAGYTFKEITGDAASGTMTGDKTVNYIYERIPNRYTLTVNYLDTNNTPIAQQEFTSNLLEGSDYTTTQKKIDGYTFKEITGDAASGKMDGNKVVNYIYDVVTYTLTVKHVNELGFDLVDPTISTENYGAEYQTQQAAIEDYTFLKMDETSDPASGKMDGDKTVIYVYKQNPKAYTYEVYHTYYLSENEGEYKLAGISDPMVQPAVLEENAPRAIDVFNAQPKTSDDKNGDTYTRLDKYAATEIVASGELAKGTLKYTVKYYAETWTEGSLVIEKEIEGLDQRTERTLKGQLEFRVTGPEGYDETFSFGEDFNSKGVLTLEKLEPGTYTIEEMGAEVGDGYKLDVRADDADEDEDGYQVEVKAGKKAAVFEITNEYTSRVYNIWFDGGSHGKVQNSNYITVEGLWRSHWHNYQQDMSDPFGDDYDWASSLRTTGKTVYGYGSGTLYPDLNEDPEIIEDTNMVLYTITAAQWAEHSRKMYIDEPALETEDGWTSNEVYYVIGTDIAFTGIGDAIEYMNDNVSPDGNGFYNVHYRPQYESEPDDTPENPYIPSGPSGPSGDPDPDPQPEIEIPEEEVPLAELPEEEVPLADIPEEEVPLSDVPKTGDDMLLYAMLAAVSGLGLGYLALTGKKREEEAAE